MYRVTTLIMPKWHDDDAFYLFLQNQLIAYRHIPSFLFLKEQIKDNNNIWVLLREMEENKFDDVAIMSLMVS
jgi:hypothetical protein